VDDNAYVGNSIGLANLASVTCDANAVCSGATCVCGVNYYGNGFDCRPATCTNNVATGFFFDATEVVEAGANATTTTCAPGLAGYATRACVWNGATSASGVWAAPVSFCQPVQCLPLSAYNATFNPVLIGSLAGVCRTGFAGTISAQCLLNVTTGTTGYWSDPVGSCTLITCEAGAYGFATWPTVAPMGVPVLANGTCAPGYTPTDPGRPPQRLCPAAGTYGTTLVNPCIRLNCSAQANFDNAAWQLTQSDTTVAGVCLPGFRAGAPLRACGIDGQWDVNVVNPCQALACPALANANGTAYSAVAAGSVATGTCLPGFGPGGSGSGSPTRACDLLGNWAATDTNPCQPLVCGARTESGATWPAATAASPAALVVGTCAPGFEVLAGAPYRGCDITGTLTAVENPCQPITCPAVPAAEAEGNATWPSAAVGAAAVAGVCLPGYTGSPVRACPAGAPASPAPWDPVAVGCVAITCPARNDESDPALGASFAEAVAGTIATGVCASGTYGRPQRQCDLAGAWAPALLRNPCSPSPCPALVADADATWPAGVPGTSVSGSCLPGYGGAPTRDCTPSGWAASPNPGCTQLVCPAATVGLASFEAATAGTAFVQGVCAPGYGGSPQRNCSVAGAWVDILTSTACTPLVCANTTDGVATSYPTAVAGTTATGVCAPGYGGSPRRVCSLLGVWLAPSGVPCVRTCASSASMRRPCQTRR
jgi:hypothetical protein